MRLALYFLALAGLLSASPALAGLFGHEDLTLLAQCRGSLNPQDGMGEPIEVVIKKGVLWVRPAMGGCYPSNCMVFRAQRTELQLQGQKLVATEKRRHLGVTTLRKSLKIDFTTGLGLATHYEAFEALLGQRKIYLTYCFHP